MTLSNGERLLRWPLDLHVITAGWLYNNGSKHQAVDFRASVGTPVYAAENGTVNYVYHWNGKRTQGDTNSYGNLVKIRHDNYGSQKLETLYAHLSKTTVLQGQSVKEGDLIGYSGNTGNCYGAHLHFEVRLKGKRVNPLCWLDDNFETASNSVYTYQSGEHAVVIPQETKDYTIKVGPMSKGDFEKFKVLAEELQVNYE